MSEILSKLYLELGALLPGDVKTKREMDLEKRIAALVEDNKRLSELLQEFERGKP